MEARIVFDSYGHTCDGACENCDITEDCEIYDGECQVRCEDCPCWSGGCEAL